MLTGTSGAHGLVYAPAYLPQQGDLASAARGRIVVLKTAPLRQVWPEAHAWVIEAPMSIEDAEKPALFGVVQACRWLCEAEPLLLDFDDGVVFAAPDAALLAGYGFGHKLTFSPA